MKRKRFSVEHIVAVTKEHEFGVLASLDGPAAQAKGESAPIPAGYTDTVAEPRSTRLRCGRRRLRERTIPSQGVST